MPCIAGDGKPTPSGMAMLRSLKDGPLPPEEVAKLVNQSLPMVRSGLRELRNAGFVEESGGKYQLSTDGTRMLE